MADVPPTSRPTLRSIATLLGVTPATVSLALRDSPDISHETRERVKRTAESLGYRPDPEIGKLMHRLRVTRTPTYRSTLYGLTDLPADEPRIARLLQGARSRATELGFDVAIEPVPSAPASAEKLGRCLSHRGVEGLLLLPFRSPDLLAHLAADWSQFAVVATSRQPIEPDFDRVVAHWYWSVLRILEALAARGFRRIGFVFSAEFDRRINHKLSAAIAHRDAVPDLRSLALFSYADLVSLTNIHGETIEAWFMRETPEAIIVDHDSLAAPLRDRLPRSAPSAVTFATLDRSPDSALAGVTERWCEIGALAVSLLSQKVLTGQKGTPAIPTVTMVKGVWAHGACAT